MQTDLTSQAANGNPQRNAGQVGKTRAAGPTSVVLVQMKWNTKVQH